MTREQLDATEIQNKHGRFYPRYDTTTIYEEVDGEIVSIEDYTITSTAEEVYQEYLNPPQTPTDKMEVLEQENKILKAQVEALGGVTDFHEELIVEMANKIYA